MNGNEVDLQKFPYIDALRGWAIMLVVFAHTRQYGDNTYPDWFSFLVFSGGLGVQLFYIVSALTLFFSLESRRKKEKHPFINFFIRRFFRIAPLFYLAVFGYLLLYGFGPRYWLNDTPYIGIWNILSTVTFLNGINPYWINSIVPGGWSIAVEMMFYLTLPFLFRTITTLSKAFWWAIGSGFFAKVLVTFLYRYPPIPNQHFWGEYLYFFFPAQLPVFLLGVTLFHVIRAQQAVSNKGQQLSWRFWLILSAVVFVQPGGFHIFSQHFSRSIGLAFFVFTLFRFPVKFFVNRFTVFVGRISFSIYLVQDMVYYFLQQSGLVNFIPGNPLDCIPRFILALFICIGVSYVTYRLVELPGQRLGKMLIQKIEGQALRQK